MKMNQMTMIAAASVFACSIATCALASQSVYNTSAAIPLGSEGKGCPAVVNFVQETVINEGGATTTGSVDFSEIATDVEFLSSNETFGFLKGKSAIAIARNFMARKRNFQGQHFWARGYYVTTLGRNEEVIRKYIREQEKEDRRVDRLFEEPETSSRAQSGSF